MANQLTSTLSPGATCILDYAEIASHIETKLMDKISQHEPWIIGLGATSLVIIIIMFISQMTILILSCVDAFKDKRRWGPGADMGLGYKKLAQKDWAGETNLLTEL